MAVDQSDLFGGSLEPTDPPRKTHARRPRSGSQGTRQFKKLAGGSPQRAAEILHEVKEGRYGVLDNTDRIVLFEDDRHVRHALDEDVIVSLISQGYVTEGKASDRVGCRHGAVIRPVMPIKLTNSGSLLLERWSALKPLDNA